MYIIFLISIIVSCINVYCMEKLDRDAVLKTIYKETGCLPFKTDFKNEESFVKYLFKLNGGDNHYLHTLFDTPSDHNKSHPTQIVVLSSDSNNSFTPFNSQFVWLPPLDRWRPFLIGINRQCYVLGQGKKLSLRINSLSVNQETVFHWNNAENPEQDNNCRLISQVGATATPLQLEELKTIAQDYHAMIANQIIRRIIYHSWKPWFNITYLDYNINPQISFQNLKNSAAVKNAAKKNLNYFSTYERNSVKNRTTSKRRWLS